MKSIGRDVGQIEYAVVEAVAGSKGAGLALKGAKTAAELAIGAERLAQIAIKSAEVLEKIKFGLRGIVRLGRKDWMGSLFRFGSDGRTLRNAARLKPKEGWYDVLLHGHNDGRRFLIDGRVVKAEELANMMLAQGYQKGTPIRLIACHSGSNATGGAARLAKILETTVEAPTNRIAIIDGGDFIIDGGGKWVTFEP